MSWLKERKAKDGTKRYSVIDRINGKKVTVVPNAGQWKEIALARQVQYDKDKAADKTGVICKRPLSIEDMVDFHIAKHAPTLRGGIDGEGAYGIRCILGRVKKLWKGKKAHEINSLDIRDVLLTLNTVGNRMKYLGTIGKMFRNFEDWSNEKGILPHDYELPKENPAYLWRRKMKSADKKELPDERVLSPEEWHKFKSHLTKRAFAICDIALRRCLRPSDIRKISKASIVEGHIKGLQSKTGEPFRVPLLDNQPTKYDFTNFADEFYQAQVKAKMDYPSNHPLHFTIKDLRRTGATWAYRDTKDLVAVQELLGHKNIATTRRYLRIEQVDITKVVRSIDFLASFSGAPGGQMPETNEKGVPK